MKKWIITIILSFCLAGMVSAQQAGWGYYAGASLQASEMNGANAIAAIVMAGVNGSRWSIAAYGLQTIHPAQTPAYRSTLESVGLEGAYLHPLGQHISLSVGMNGSCGKATLEAIQGPVSEGTLEEDIYSFSPQAGIVFPLGGHLSLTYETGYRWVWGAERLEARSYGAYSSLFSTVTLKAGFFPAH